MKEKEAAEHIKNASHIAIDNGYSSAIVDACFLAVESLLMREGGGMSEWIPVSERLPEKPGVYLCTTEYGGMRILAYSKNLYEVDEYAFWDRKGEAGFYEYDSEYGYFPWNGIEAWMQLPEPYKKEEK